MLREVPPPDGGWPALRGYSLCRDHPILAHRHQRFIDRGFAEGREGMPDGAARYPELAATANDRPQAIDELEDGAADGERFLTRWRGYHTAGGVLLLLLTI